MVWAGQATEVKWQIYKKFMVAEGHNPAPPSPLPRVD